MNDRLKANLSRQPEALLTVALLLIAAFLVFIALWPDHALVKAIVLTWVILP